jgi:hypothetical protein
MIVLQNLIDGVLAYEHLEAPTKPISKFIAYVDSINKKDKKGKDMTFSMSVTDLVKLYIKYKNIDVQLDGINAVITGFNKVFITWVGYKNKVLSVYPESEFDIQLVRENDVTSFAKESGSVIYSHTIADPFSSNKGIIGSYCVIKNKRGEFLETLGKDDYQNMKQSALLASTWDKWESEFWLKSVIKRACKRHFNDIVAEIETLDNEDYDLNVGADDDQKKAILEAHSDNNSPSKSE